MVERNLNIKNKKFMDNIKAIDNISEIKKHINNIKVNRRQLQEKSIEELKAIQNSLNIYLNTLESNINNKKDEIIQYDKTIEIYKKRLE